MARVRNMYLTNERNFTLDVSLWEQFIEVFDSPVLAEESKTSPVVVACSSMQLRVYQEKYGLKTFSGSRFYLDKAIPEIDRFLQSLPQGLEPICIEDQPSSQRAKAQGPSAYVRPPAKRITLVELTGADSENVHADFECIAEITAIGNPFTWAYPSCPKCNYKLRDPDTAPYCPNPRCQVHRTQPEPWYRIVVEVADGTTSAEFVLIGKQAESVVGLSARAASEQQNPNPDDAIPAILNLIGKKFMFTVSVKELSAYHNYQNFTVVRVGPVPPEYAALQIVALPGSSGVEKGGPIAAQHAGVITALHTENNDVLALPAGTPPGTVVHQQTQLKRKFAETHQVGAVPVRNVVRGLNFDGTGVDDPNSDTASSAFKQE